MSLCLLTPSRDATQIDEENILATQTRLPGLTRPAQHQDQPTPHFVTALLCLQIMQQLEMVAWSGLALMRESLLEIIGRDHCGYL